MYSARGGLTACGAEVLTYLLLEITSDRQPRISQRGDKRILGSGHSPYIVCAVFAFGWLTCRESGRATATPNNQ